MKDKLPKFPPLLTGHGVPGPAHLAGRAKEGARSGALAAGDLLWAEDTDKLRWSLVLEPEVETSRCYEMVFVAMVAIGDAIGAISPPEVALTYQWPNQILLNAGVIGAVLIDIGASDGDVPAYLILTANINIRPASPAGDPGLQTAVTTMWDEGCGDISRTDLLESSARHLVKWIHIWGEDGFKPVHENWWRRIEPSAKINPGLARTGEELIGIDANGSALLRAGGLTRHIPVHEGLQQPPTLPDQAP